MSRGLLEEKIIFSTKPKRDYWEQYRNAQRTFLCAQGKFPNFLDKAWAANIVEKFVRYRGHKEGKKSC